jgi:hypothetical protein
MYSKIMQEIKTEYYQQNYPNDGQRFVAWYLRNIHLRDGNEAKADITDGADDKQIDAIVVNDATNCVYIVQGKFIGSGKVDAEPLREVLSSWVQLKDLIRLQETGNTKLKQKLSDLSMALEDDYDVHFELITTAGLTESALKDFATFQKALAEADDLPASIHLVDDEELQKRYELALETDNPVINDVVVLEEGKYVHMTMANTQVLIAALPLKDCLNLKGIKDGSLFQKNVRQSLGLANRVNKGIKETIYKRPNDFYFFHNGITALCSKMEFDKTTRKLSLHSLSVVNGCQSLTTLLSCSEQVKKLNDSYVMFRFYEISTPQRSEDISTSTNSQSAVKPRDLRSNDKRVLSLKKQFEQKYPTGYLVTKRGEDAPAVKDKKYVLDLSDLGKYLITWQSQRPNIAYSETKVFDKYFDQLFKRDYLPENSQALNAMMQAVRQRWGKENPLGLNDSLLAMRAYAPYHHLYAVSQCFSVISKAQGVPSPSKAYEKLVTSNKMDQIVDIAGACLNSALEAAVNEPQPANRVFSPQNWIKTKTCLAGIRAAINQYFMMLPTMPGGKAMSLELNNALQMEPGLFEERWAAD